MKKILDLSKPSNWLKVAEKVAQECFSTHLISTLRSHNHEEMYSDSLSYLTENPDEEDCFETAETLTAEFEEHFLERYDQIRAFHACRPFLGVESYRKNGIRKASSEIIREIGHAAFSAHCSREQIDKAIDNYEFLRSDNSVYLFTDDWNPTRDCQNHYLQSGSEILQALSFELGLGSQGILAAQASPCLIECNVPINQVSLGFRGELLRTLTTIFFKISAGKRTPTRPIDFCIRVIEDIAPESIVDIHTLEDSKLKYTLPRH